MNLRFCKALRFARQLIVFFIGVSVALVGLVFIFTTGPAVIVIPIGLGIIILDFVWSRYLLRQAHAHLRTEVDRIQNDIYRRKPLR